MSPLPPGRALPNPIPCYDGRSETSHGVPLYTPVLTMHPRHGLDPPATNITRSRLYDVMNLIDTRHTQPIDKHAYLYHRH